MAVRNLARMLVMVMLAPAGLLRLATSTSLFTVRITRLHLGTVVFGFVLNLSTE